MLVAVNYQTFERSVGRAGRALYMENDAEKSLRILMTLIAKLQGNLYVYELIAVEVH